MSGWLVTGGGGRLGGALHELLGDRIVVADRLRLDITSAAAVAGVFARVQPDVVINAAALTSVHAAELSPERAHAVNSVGVANLADAATRCGAHLIHVSSSAVFDGDAVRPYEIDDDPTPRTVYGRSKIAGELFALTAGATVVRTAWLHGGRGSDFVRTAIRSGASHEVVEVADDEIGSPTWVYDLAAAIVAIGARGVHPGLVHYANAGHVSRYEVVHEAFRLAGLDTALLRPIEGRAAPASSMLSTVSWTRASLPAPRDWKTALAAALRWQADAGTNEAGLRVAEPARGTASIPRARSGLRLGATSV